MVSREDILAEIVELTTKPVVGPEDVSLGECAEAMGVSRDSARRRMQEQVDQGLYATEVKLDTRTSKYVRCYWKLPLDNDGENVV